MDNLGALQVFVRAADSRSFTRAGQQLGISSSAVGKAIARLEERLQVRLFHRSTRSITLTEEGGIFLERCRRIFCEVEAAELELAQLQETPRGKLRISLPYASMRLTMPLIAFMQRYPDIELDLDFNDQMVDVIEDGFDAVIRGADINDSRLMARKLGDVRLQIMAAPDYLAARGTPKTPEDLLDHNCLLHRFAGTGHLEPWPLVRDSQPIDLPLPKSAISNTIEPLVHMTSAGLGIASLPDFAIKSHLQDGRLVPVLEDFTEYSRPVYLLWPFSRYLSPKLRVFIDFMANRLFAD